jgi:hypothetical protein
MTDGLQATSHDSKENKIRVQRGDPIAVAEAVDTEDEDVDTMVRPSINRTQPSNTVVVPLSIGPRLSTKQISQITTRKFQQRLRQMTATTPSSRLK